MIKIIQLIHGKHFGGGEKVVLQLANHLSLPEIDCEVICLSTGRLYSLLTQAGTKTHLIPMQGKLDFSVVFRIVSVLRKCQCDIIQSHTGRTHLLARLASLFVRVKKLATVQSPVLLDSNINLRPKKLNALIEKLTARWSDMFVAVSEEGRKALLEQSIPAEKVFLVHNGVNLQRLLQLNPEQKIQLRQELGFSSEDLIAAMIAQLRPRKGAEFFINAMPAIKQAVPHSKFMIVGDAEFVEDRDYLHELRQLAKNRGVKDELKFTGFRPDAYRIMEVVDVLVLPSLFGEGLPLVLVEAMAHNLPIVATDTAGNKEVVVNQETGYLVPPGNSETLTEKITNLLSSADLRKKMGIAARKRAEELFSLTIMIEKYKAIYRQLAKNP